MWAVSAPSLFPTQANGSLVTLVERHGRRLGADRAAVLHRRKYFHPRPSAAGNGYDAMASGASNLGPTSKTLVSEVDSRVTDVLATDPGAKLGSIPVDMVTASGSGLDPDISPDDAYLQVARVAKARGLSATSVHDLVTSHVVGRTLGVLGEPRVNVLDLNLALDALK